MKKTLIYVECETHTALFVTFDRDPTPYQMMKITKKLGDFDELMDMPYKMGRSQVVVLVRDRRNAKEPPRISRSFALPEGQEFNLVALQQNESDDARRLATFIRDFAYPGSEEKISLRTYHISEDELLNVMMKELNETKRPGHPPGEGKNIVSFFQRRKT